MVPETPVPAVADSGSRGNRVSLASQASVGLRTVSLHKVRRHRAEVLSQASAVAPRGAQHRGSQASQARVGLRTASLHKVSRHRAGVLSRVSAAAPRDVPHRVSLPRGAR